MDEMKVKLSTKMMRGLVAKLIEKAISKKLGYKIDIQIDEVEVIHNEDGRVHLHLNVDAETSTGEFMDIVKNFTKD